MIESNDLSEGYVLTVQTRQEALAAAVDVYTTGSGVLLTGELDDQIIATARKFENYLQRG